MPGFIPEVLLLVLLVLLLELFVSAHMSKPLSIFLKFTNMLTSAKFDNLKNNKNKNKTNKEELFMGSASDNWR